MSKNYIYILLTHKLNEIFIWLKCVYNIYSIYMKVKSILSLLPLLFLSQRLVYVTVVFVVIIIWLLISSSFNIYIQKNFCSAKTLIIRSLVIIYQVRVVFYFTPLKPKLYLTQSPKHFPSSRLELN